MGRANIGEKVCVTSSGRVIPCRGGEAPIGVVLRREGDYADVLLGGKTISDNVGTAWAVEILTYP
jgi:hypothetical protein